MNGRSTLVVIGVVLGLTGCTEQGLGRQEPVCDPTELTNAIVLAAQSVPGTGYAPCINELKVGWSFEHLVAESGRSRFWLSSDRIGVRFLEATLQARCDLDDAVEVLTDEPDARRFDHVIVSDLATTVTIVPEGNEPGARAYADELRTRIAASVVGWRRLDTTIDRGPRTTQQRIDAALAADLPVLVASARGREEGTVELQLPSPGGGPPDVRETLTLARALDRIEQQLDEPRYQARWYYLFDGGCVTYDIDAHGPGVTTVRADVAKALGLYPLAPARAWAWEQGYVVP